MPIQKPHTVSLSDFHWDKLTEFADSNSLNRSEVLRRLIEGLDTQKKEEKEITSNNKNNKNKEINFEDTPNDENEALNL